MSDKNLPPAAGMTPEAAGASFREQLVRVEQMAESDGEGEVWDLSVNDGLALKAVLADRQRLAAGVKGQALDLPEGPIDDLLAYGRAQAGNYLRAKNREEYLFWQGWNAALERVAPLRGPQEAAEQSDPNRAGRLLQVCECGHPNAEHVYGEQNCAHYSCSCIRFFVSAAPLRASQAVAECRGCARGLDTVMLDDAGTRTDLSHRPGVPSHGVGDSWWPCAKWVAAPLRGSDEAPQQENVQNEESLARVEWEATTPGTAAEMLWVVLANVSGGDWTKQSVDWQEAAARWRDNYFAVLSRESAPPASTNAVDPSAQLSGTPTPRDKVSSSSTSGSDEALRAKLGELVTQLRDRSRLPDVRDAAWAAGYVTGRKDSADDLARLLAGASHA